jgi:hypothetical protein
MIRYEKSAVVAECYFCGKTTECTRFTAETFEPETGYREEREICFPCQAKMKYGAPAISS